MSTVPKSLTPSQAENEPSRVWLIEKRFVSTPEGPWLILASQGSDPTDRSWQEHRAAEFQCAWPSCVYRAAEFVRVSSLAPKPEPVEPKGSDEALAEHHVEHLLSESDYTITGEAAR